ncbi:MAG TPA: amino acid permease, partial [Thermoplasmata archaeon]|nr:amino acid permease [Thermoplasmata archaeon]
MPEERAVSVRVVADLGLFDVVMMGLGAMVGTSIYVLVGGAALVGGPAVLLALLLNGGLVLLTAVAYVELATVHPRSGGGYAWVKEGLKTPFGFVAGVLTWGGGLTAVALSALGLASFLGYVLRVNGISLVGDAGELTVFSAAFRPSEKILAVGAVAAFTALNMRPSASRGPGFVPFLKIALLALFVALGIAAVLPRLDTARLADAPPFGFGGVVLAMGVTFIAFEGYEVIAGSSEEVRDPRRTLPRALLLAVVFVTVVYALLFVTALDLVPVDSSCAAAWRCLGAGFEPELGLVRASAATGLLDPLPLVVLLTGGIVATAAGVSSNAASSARTAVVLARDSVLPGRLARTWRDGRTPVNALIASFVIVLALVLVLDLFALALASAIFFLLLFALVNVSLIVHRRRAPLLPWRFRPPLVPALPIAAAVLSVGMALYLWTFPPMPDQPGARGSGVIAWYLVLLWLGVGLVYHFFAGGREMLKAHEGGEVADLLGGEDQYVLERYRVFLPLKSFGDADLVRLGALIARTREGELSLLNVVEVPRNLPPKALRFSYVDARIKGLQRLAREARTLGVEARATVKIGHKPYELILDTMREEDVNLLLLGWPPGRGEAILGTNIDSLIEGAPCAVAVARTRGLP